MPLTIRAPTIDELSDLSDLCFRSKAVWGYDVEFMDACRAELSFEPRDLELTPIAVAEHYGKPIGVAQVKVVDDEADLLKLFVEPSALRSGTGKALLVWATDVAKKLGATRLIIEADPDAAPFYRRMGAYDVGQAPSGSVPGRMLPKLAMNFDLRTNLPVRNWLFCDLSARPRCGRYRGSGCSRVSATMQLVVVSFPPKLHVLRSLANTAH